MSEEETLIRAKSIALIQKTKLRVAQIDPSAFPTGASDKARDLVARTLDLLESKAASPALNAEALFNSLIRLQELVDEVEASSSEHISWPLVSYCDRVWAALFPSADRGIFYSVTQEHNYTISRFSTKLELLLKPITDSTERATLIGTTALYCLQVASLEEENLPLYAVIGHEFGHAVFHAHGNAILTILQAEIRSLIAGIFTDFERTDSHTARRRTIRTVRIIKAIAIELLCDLVGLLISGPAFFLSLYELGWGSDENQWTGKLLPSDAHIVGYPSFAFRIHCLKARTTLSTYETNAAKEFQRIDNRALKELASFQAKVASDHSSDRVVIAPDADPDKDAIQAVMTARLVELKAQLEAFLHRCDDEFLASYKSRPQFSAVSAEQVAALLQRLENNILPNIVPDGTLLGTPANFGAILNASAIYRLYLLQSISTSEPQLIRRELEKIERLTAKALEVSYIQQEYNVWDVNDRK